MDLYPAGERVKRAADAARKVAARAFKKKEAERVAALPTGGGPALAAPDTDSVEGSSASSSDSGSGSGSDTVGPAETPAAAPVETPAAAPDAAVVDVGKRSGSGTGPTGPGGVVAGAAAATGAATGGSVASVTSSAGGDDADWANKLGLKVEVKYGGITLDRLLKKMGAKAALKSSLEAVANVAANHVKITSLLPSDMNVTDAGKVCVGE